MSPHKAIYFKHFNLTPGDWVKCEIPECGLSFDDIHHIECRGMGGNPKGDKNRIENLMALCREHHLQLGDRKQFKDYLKEVHNRKLNGI